MQFRCFIKSGGHVAWYTLKMAEEPCDDDDDDDDDDDGGGGDGDGDDDVDSMNPSR